ncbi:hypothetical protein RRU01S_35_00390 [Agrobacterium rubi TR3 = NBRC 13261]|uniref:Uncharacterized protein n=1 Tax=Agrobacterium rubi TR3 = NBRC 13261 TaxID=1368415 RepID=A0A081D334_9HYPH|nr:hypothetical protein [Agrobacterium rubi]MBP1881633.1 hypothetical protein [Agrobacterium rubi]MCL6652155.1 hypothetical protein [Agrobacterium rubi]GAK73330.1 hypothetical protein RRU01S_35_00390 [Agrobacterium rubi TR3 = NBRC 13261]
MPKKNEQPDCFDVADNPAMMAAIVEEAQKTEAELVGPSQQFRNWGVQLQHNWSTTGKNAAFGTDYDPNRCRQVQHFGQFLDGNEIFL